MYASCLDARGCNWSAFGLAYLMSLLAPVCLVGWVWSCIYGHRVYNDNKGKV